MWKEKVKKDVWNNEMVWLRNVNDMMCVENICDVCLEYMAMMIENVK